MKLIIIEGSDKLGKNSLIKELCEYYNYDNISIRHFGKPPKGIIPNKILKFQFKAFEKEMKLFQKIQKREFKNKYYDEIMIWNRSHLGEYVYSQMFRGGNPETLKEMLIKYEKGFLNFDVSLITLTSSPEFLNSRISDGNELSKTFEEKAIELKLFKEAHEFRTIQNKILIKVNNDIIFKSKKEIFDEAIYFINN